MSPLRLVLDGRSAATLDALHAAIAAQPGVPAHYGRNLDALHDLLTTGTVEVTLVTTDTTAWGYLVRRVCGDAQAVNPGLTVVEQAG